MRRILLAVLVAVAAPASAATVIWTGEVHVEKWLNTLTCRRMSALLAVVAVWAGLVDVAQAIAAGAWRRAGHLAPAL